MCVLSQGALQAYYKCSCILRSVQNKQNLFLDPLLFLSVKMPQQWNRCITIQRKLGCCQGRRLRPEGCTCPFSDLKKLWPKKKKKSNASTLNLEPAPTSTEDIDISRKVSQDYQIFNTNRVVSKVTQTFHFFQEFSLRPYMSSTAGGPQIITLNLPGTALVLPWRAETTPRALHSLPVVPTGLQKLCSQ